MKAKLLLCVVVVFLLATRGGFAVGEVWLGKELVFRVDSPEARPKIIKRLELAVLKGVSAAQVSVRREGSDYTLYGGKVPIVTVTPGSAHHFNTTPHSLAVQWAKRLQVVLSTGEYLVIPSELAIPVGETRNLSIKGHFAGRVSVQVLNSRVCSFNSEENSYQLRGLRSGTTLIKVSSGELKQEMSVLVRDFAGNIPKRTSLVLTGAQIPISYLKHVLPEAIQSSISQREGTELVYKIPTNLLPSKFSQGQTFDLQIPAKISGEGYFPARGNLVLSVQAKSFPVSSCAHLLLSNSPENFTRPGTLFSGTPPDGSPIRVFFHHHNKGKKLLEFVLDVINPLSDPAEMHVLEAEGGPSNDELHVGRNAAERFFGAYRDRLGRVLSINPESSYRLVQMKIPPGQTYSGILQLTPLNRERPTVRARIVSPHEEENAELLSGEIHKAKGVFPSPDLLINSEYVTGKDYAFISIGKRELLHDLITGEPDFGNYGALYTIRFVMRNPVSSPREAHVMFVPQAGPAGGVFLVDGQSLVITPIVSPFVPYSILKVELKPHEVRTITIQTTPLGGSFYPVNIVAQP